MSKGDLSLILAVFSACSVFLNGVAAIVVAAFAAGVLVGRIGRANVGR